MVAYGPCGVTFKARGSLRLFYGEQLFMRGKTYTLGGPSGSSVEYFQLIRNIADRYLEEYQDEDSLLALLRDSGSRRSLFRRLFGSDNDHKDLSESLSEYLSKYTNDTAEHLRDLSITDRFDSIIATKEEEYHLNMLEIEVANRVNRGPFRESEYKMALMAHCLRDFRDYCRSEPGEIEYLCRHCEKECFVHTGSMMLEKYGIKSYISATMDHKKLFSGLKKQHPGLGALGIACIPQLVQGMRLCGMLDIPALGVPLDVNRCAIWLGWTGVAWFNLEELETLLS